MNKATINSNLTTANGKAATYHLAMSPMPNGHLPAAQKALFESLTT
jgi:hypothetical protein